MKNNEYIEEFKIQAVRRIYSGESQKMLCNELGISKSTLWGWKCKYHTLIESELKTIEKPIREKRFVEIIRPMKETKTRPLFRYQKDNIVEIDYKGYNLFCDVSNLKRTLEMLNND